MPVPVVAYRAHASHLDERVAEPSVAAWGGLQDSAPRAALMSLRARLAGCTPDSWEHPDLAQLWFRSADYVVPRDALAAFTIGRMPRDPAAARSLESLADSVHEICAGEMRPTREIVLDDPLSLRLTSITGRVLIRWDASRIWAIPCDRPDGDVEEARIELARRFVHWYAPATLAMFVRWSGVEASDARETWAALDLEPVEVDGQTRFVLSSDRDALLGAEPIAGVRLLPMDDVLIKYDHDIVVADPARRELLYPSSSRGFLPGAVLIDGEVAGVWQRQQRRVTVERWRTFSGAEIEAVEAEALSLPIAKGKASVTWT